MGFWANLRKEEGRMGFRVVRNRDEDAGADYGHASLLSKWIQCR